MSYCREAVPKGAVWVALLIAALAAGSFCASEASKKAGEGDQKHSTLALASVGDKSLLLDEFNGSLELLQLKEHEELTLEKKKALVENWILTQLVADEALKRGFAKREAVKSRLEKSRAMILSDEFLREELTKITATDEDVSKYYESHRDLFTIPETERLSVITLGTQEAAEAALKRLSAGEDFAALAKTLSIDKYRDSGGDAGIIAKSNELPEYLRAAFYLREGSLSDVIQCEGGYCILKVVAKSPAKALKFEDFSPKLKSATQESALREKRAKRVLELQKELETKVAVKRNLNLLEE